MVDSRVVLAFIGLQAVGVALAAGARRRDRARQGGRTQGLWGKFASYFAITAGTLFVGSLPRPLFLLVLGAGTAGFLQELYGATRFGPRAEAVRRWGTVYILAGCSGALALKDIDPGGNAWAFLWLLVGMTDGYAQLLGQGWGHAKLAPAVSPEKTWFGFIGATAISVLVGSQLTFVFPGATAMGLAKVSLITSLCATLGDLMESYGKRCLGIKDFSRFLGKHGGLLDRYDSLLAAAPVFALLVRKGMG
jgi:CDP-diglyceride synthetase